MKTAERKFLDSHGIGSGTNKYRGNLKVCFEAGFSSVKDGPNTENCHFGLFATKEMTKAWEAGVKYAKEE